MSCYTGRWIESVTTAAVSPFRFPSCYTGQETRRTTHPTTAFPCHATTWLCSRHGRREKNAPPWTVMRISCARSSMAGQVRVSMRIQSFRLTISSANLYPNGCYENRRYLFLPSARRDAAQNEHVFETIVEIQVGMGPCGEVCVGNAGGIFGPGRIIGPASTVWPCPQSFGPQLCLSFGLQ
jgi:hypothetical protein